MRKVGTRIVRSLKAACSSRLCANRAVAIVNLFAHNPNWSSKNFATAAGQSIATSRCALRRQNAETIVRPQVLTEDHQRPLRQQTSRVVSSNTKLMTAAVAFIPRNKSETKYLTIDVSRDKTASSPPLRLGGNSTIRGNERALEQQPDGCRDQRHRASSRVTINARFLFAGSGNGC